jgi:cell division protein FtsQ
MTVLEAAQRFTEATRQRRTRRWIALGVAAALVALAVWVVWFSTLLSVKEVRVIGAVDVSADSVREAAAVPSQEQLARVDVAGISERVGALPRVASVEVRRGWPDVLVIVVTERQPVAVTSDAGTLHYVDSTGVEFGTVASAPTGMPVVTAVTPDALTSAAAVLGELPDVFRAGVGAVQARTRDDIVLVLRSGQAVRWGSAEDSARKLVVLRALLRVPAASYDVSAPDLPTSSGSPKPTPTSASKP